MEHPDSILPSLKALCTRVVHQILASISSFGSMSYDEAKPFLQQMEAAHLRDVEENSPHLMSETDDLWRAHCLREFIDIRLANERGQLDTPESWRDLYSEAYESREAKFENLQQRLQSNYRTIAAEKEDKKIQVIAPPPPKRRNTSSSRNGPAPVGTSLINKARKAAKVSSMHFATTARTSAFAAKTSPTRDRGVRPSTNAQGMAMYNLASTAGSSTSPTAGRSTTAGSGSRSGASHAPARSRPAMGRPPDRAATSGRRNP